MTIVTRASRTPGSNWEAKKIKLKMKYPQLTNDDLSFDETKKEEMLKKLEVTLGKTVEELHDIIETL